MKMSDATATTIAAIASPPGVGAVSMIRISGPDAIQIANHACHQDIDNFSPRTAHLCSVTATDKAIIDDGLITIFKAPHSYTGETTVEFTGHGGVLVTKEVLQRFIECGATPAEPGEFTRRAFLNGKLDLTQAEGVMDVISAQTRLALRAAHNQLEGKIGQETLRARDELLDALAHLEAFIDFPEEDIDPQTGELLRSKIQAVLNIAQSLLSTADQGRLLREGVRTVIYGEPNVGKSSLLNQLLGFERAIVSDIAGTTRDTIEETINLGGIPLRLTDTAGVRESDDSIESEGIQRTLKQINSADLLLEVADVSQPKPNLSLISDIETQKILILNKSDLPEDPSWKGVEGIRLSCTTQHGFDELTQSIHLKLHFSDVDWGDHAIAINSRHQASLQKATTSLETAIALLEKGTDTEIVAIDLREALDALGEIPGKVDTEDLLGVIFSSFCIGK